MAREVDWPQAEATGEVFDLDWYDAGTAKAITAAEQEFIDRAFKAADPGAILYGPSVPAYVRTEYHRRYFVRTFGTQFLISNRRSWPQVMCGASSTWSGRTSSTT